MAMRKGRPLPQKLPHVDFVVGTNNITIWTTYWIEVLYSKLERRVFENRGSIRGKLDYSVTKRTETNIKGKRFDHSGLRQILHLLRRTLYRGSEVSESLQAS